MPTPVSGYGVTLFWRWKTFLILPAPSAPAKAKGESIQLWERGPFREIISAPNLHLLHPLPRFRRFAYMGSLNRIARGWGGVSRGSCTEKSISHGHRFNDFGSVVGVGVD